MRPIFGRQNTSGGRELGSGDFSAHGAGRDANLWMVTDTLVFSRVAAGHDVKLAILFGEPDRSAHGGAILSKASEADVLLPLNLGWNRLGHALIVGRSTDLLLNEVSFRQGGRIESRLLPSAPVGDKLYMR